MKSSIEEPPEDFKLFHIAGTHLSLTRMIDYCSECPVLAKDNPQDLYSDGFCMLRDVRKKRIDKVPSRCRSVFINGGKTGGEIILEKSEL